MADQEKIFIPGGATAERTIQPTADRPALTAHESEPLKSKRPMSGCMKLLLGCGCGCVSLTVLAVVAGVVLFWWAIAEKPLDPPEIFIDSSAVSIAHLKIDKNNPVSMPLVEDLHAEFLKRNGEEVTEWKDVLVAVNLMETAWPIQITAVSRHGLVSATEKKDLLIIFSYARLSNLINWLWKELGASELSRDPTSVIEYDGANILPVRRVEKLLFGNSKKENADSYMSCLESNVVVATDIERVKEAISRQRSKKADFGGNELLKEMFRSLSTSRDAWGIIINSANLLDRELAFLQERGEMIDFSNVDALCWDAKAVGADKAEGTIRFKCKDNDTATRLADAIRRAKENIELNASEKDMKLAISPSARGKFVEVEFTLEEFRDNLVRSFFKD